MGPIKKINTKIIILISKIKRFFNPLLQTKDDPLFSKYNIGEFTYGTPRILKYNSTNNLKIGKFCSIAEGVKIFLGGEHKTNKISTYPFKERLNWGDVQTEFSKGNVTIGNDVWIGQDATILSGVEIKDGAIIGAGAVVAKSVEPYSIVIGSPCQTIRKRFDEKTIKKLLKLKWWNWNINKIKRNVSFLTQTPEKLLDKTNHL
ncbi:MAG: CatB-related O-acetyltransferase [archaeon]